MLAINKIHHIAIICSDYQASKRFYCEVLGFNLISEVYREERDSWKADLALHDQYTIELFSFPSPVPRPSRPEACGLRHLAFQVDDIDLALKNLSSRALFAKQFALIPTLNHVLLSLMTQMVYHWSYMN